MNILVMGNGVIGFFKRRKFGNSEDFGSQKKDDLLHLGIWNKGFVKSFVGILETLFTAKLK